MDCRKEFEQSMLFRGDLVKKTGLARSLHGEHYVIQNVERLYQGYEAASRDWAGKLRRYDPERYLAVGLMNQINGEIAKQGLPPGAISEDIVRIVLRCVGGTPA